MDALFDYPIDLANAVAQRWPAAVAFIRAVAPRRAFPPLPSDFELAGLSELAYHVSFLTEEARPVQATLLYMPNMDGSDDFATSDFALVRFPPRTASVAEVMRLAPACDPEHTAIVVCSGKHGSLQLGGLLHLGSSWTQHVAGELLFAGTFHASVPPGFLAFHIRSPAHIAVSVYGHNIVVLRDGKLSAPHGSVLREASSKLADRFAVARRDYVEEARDAGSRTAYDFDFLLRFTFDAFLFQILRRTADQRHGGAFIVVRNAADIGSLESDVRIKYRCDFDRAWGLLIDSFDTDKNKAGHALREATDAARLISSLTSVDGAVIMTDHFRVLGFGCEIIVAKSPANIHMVVDKSGGKGPPQSIDGYGTRHRSAFRLCSARPDLLVFVVSQDGGVRAVTGNDGVAVWPDVLGAGFL